jgi:hypothetical protein
MCFKIGVGGAASFIVLTVISCSGEEVDLETGAQVLQCRPPDYLQPPDWNAHKDDALDPLNLIISGNSDITIDEFKEMLNQGDPSWEEVFSGFAFVNGECINPVQASVNAGSPAVTQQFAMRPLGCSPPHFFSRRQESPLQNHFRAWPQNASGAWFLAVSEEHFCPPHIAHCIDSNGFNKGRFDLVEQVVDIAIQRGMEIKFFGECQDPMPEAGCLAVGQDLRPSGTNQDGVPFDEFVALLTFKKPGAPPPLPAGSYRATCRACGVDLTGLLTCICDDLENLPISSSLNSCDCGSLGVSNCNGGLACGTCQLPPGSYQQSCTNCFARSDRLTCGTCTRIDGTENNVPTLPLPCSGDIINCDGVLRCGSC